MDVSAQEARFQVLGLEEEDALSEHDEQSDNDGDNEGRTVEGIAFYFCPGSITTIENTTGSHWLSVSSFKSNNIENFEGSAGRRVK